MVRRLYTRGRLTLSCEVYSILPCNETHPGGYSLSDSKLASCPLVSTGQSTADLIRSGVMQALLRIRFIGDEDSCDASADLFRRLPIIMLSVEHPDGSGRMMMIGFSWASVTTGQPMALCV